MGPNLIVIKFNFSHSFLGEDHKKSHLDSKLIINEIYQKIQDADNSKIDLI